MISFKGVCLQNICKCHTISRMKIRGREQTAILITDSVMLGQGSPISVKLGYSVGFTVQANKGLFEPGF